MLLMGCSLCIYKRTKIKAGLGCKQGKQAKLDITYNMSAMYA